MNKLRGELIRIRTNDGLELHGILYEPVIKSNKIILHIHGWTGNFYENVFIENIANICINNGLAFCSFNTRGAGFVQEFLKKSSDSAEYVKIGGSLELFEDCLIDIKGALDFLQEKGFTNFVLEGHSTGCQKVIYYTHKSKNDQIKGLILLEPADDPSIVKKILSERYDEAIEYADKLMQSNKPNNPMPDWIPFGVNLSAQRFLSIACSNSVEGEILHLPGELATIKSLNCPVLTISAEKSEYQDATSMQNRLKEVIKNSTTELITNSGHWFFGFEERIGEIINNWNKSLID